MNRRWALLLLIIGCGIRLDGLPQAENQVTEPLENTYWKVIRLGNNTPIVWPSQEREPHLILHPHNGSVIGSTGCNRLMGNYRVRGKRLTFSKIGGTEKACAEGKETEKAFLDALSKTRRWKIKGQQLELLDSKGTGLAQLEVRYLR